MAATIENHLDSYESEMSLKVKTDIYVDNLITRTDAFGKTLLLYNGETLIFTEARMNLCGWTSNDKDVNMFIACCEILKILGHFWNASSVTIFLKEVNLVLEPTNSTKRTVL